MKGMTETTGKDCIWAQEDEDGDHWVTDCGNELILNEGGPVDNGMEYCCYCGSKLTELYCSEL